MTYDYYAVDFQFHETRKPLHFAKSRDGRTYVDGCFSAWRQFAYRASLLQAARDQGQMSAYHEQ